MDAGRACAICDAMTARASARQVLAFCAVNDFGHFWEDMILGMQEITCSVWRICFADAMIKIDDS